MREEEGEEEGKRKSRKEKEVECPVKISGNFQDFSEILQKMEEKSF